LFGIPAETGTKTKERRAATKEKRGVSLISDNHGMHGEHGKDASREGATAAGRGRPLGSATTAGSGNAQSAEMGGIVRELLELRGMVGWKMM
jgi:hypothetical protein